MSAVIAKNLALFNLRKRKGWSQEEAARRLEIPLISYQKIEQGKSEGKVNFWRRVQRIYELSDEDMWSVVNDSI